MMKDFRLHAKELSTAGQYEDNLTLLIMKSALMAGGDGNEDFRYPLRSLKEKLNSALVELGFMSR